MLDIKVACDEPRDVGFCCYAHVRTPMLLDVDECLLSNGGCDSKRACTNTAGGCTCGDCASGWTNEGDTGCTGLDLGVETGAN